MESFLLLFQWCQQSAGPPWACCTMQAFSLQHSTCTLEKEHRWVMGSEAAKQSSPTPLVCKAIKIIAVRSQCFNLCEPTVG